MSSLARSLASQHDVIEGLVAPCLSAATRARLQGLLLAVGHTANVQAPGARAAGHAAPSAAGPRPFRHLAAQARFAGLALPPPPPLLQQQVDVAGRCLDGPGLRRAGSAGLVGLDGLEGRSLAPAYEVEPLTEGLVPPAMATSPSAAAGSVPFEAAAVTAAAVEAAAGEPAAEAAAAPAPPPSPAAAAETGARPAAPGAAAHTSAPPDPAHAPVQIQAAASPTPPCLSTPLLAEQASLSLPSQPALLLPRAASPTLAATLAQQPTGAPALTADAPTAQDCVPHPHQHPTAAAPPNEILHTHAQPAELARTAAVVGHYMRRNGSRDDAHAGPGKAPSGVQQQPQSHTAAATGTPGARAAPPPPGEGVLRGALSSSSSMQGSPCGSFRAAQGEGWGWTSGIEDESMDLPGLNGTGLRSGLDGSGLHSGLVDEIGWHLGRPCAPCPLGAGVGGRATAPCRALAEAPPSPAPLLCSRDECLGSSLASSWGGLGGSAAKIPADVQAAELQACSRESLSGPAAAQLRTPPSLLACAGKNNLYCNALYGTSVASADESGVWT